MNKAQLARLFSLAVLLLTACGAPTSPAVATLPAVPLPPPTPTYTPGPPTADAAASRCQQVAAAPTPDAALAASLFPLPGQGAYDHLRGAQDAPATIIVYSDFACPTCAPLARLLERLQQAFPEDLRLVYRHFPILTAYPNAGTAARAAEAAHLQGKFWEMHDALFEHQAEWVELPEPALTEYLLGLAAQIGLEPGQFESDLVSPSLVEIPEKAFQSGLEMGLPGAPLLLINGQIYTGPINYTSLEFVVGLIALGKRQFSTCPETVIDPARRYYATLKTEKGDVVLRLYADLAPLTVNNFVFLARQGWYKDITFHRVIPGFVAQTGDPSGTGAGNPGYLIADEIDPTLKFSRAGLVGMANSGPDTNGSQFFITLGPAPHLDGSYTLFGEVISGLEVLEQLTPRNPQPGFYEPPGDRLFDVVIEER